MRKEQPTSSPLVRTLRSLTVALILTYSFCSCNVRSADHHGTSDNEHHRRLQASAQENALKSFHDARAAAFDQLNLIHQRFEFSSPRVQFLLVSTNLPTAAWDILKYKAAKKFVEGNSTFSFLFGGSSVTAGHDNYYNESYPFVFERRMQGAFKALKIDLQVRNIGHEQVSALGPLLRGIGRVQRRLDRLGAELRLRAGQGHYGAHGPRGILEQGCYLLHRLGWIHSWTLPSLECNSLQLFSYSCNFL